MNTGVEMANPRGNLTGRQLEIMRVIWDAARPVTAAEIWVSLNSERPIARTTAVTLVKRLTERGWLAQTGEGRGAIYSATCEQPDVTHRMSKDFLDRFFGGSPSRFVMNLIGSETLSESEVEKLKGILAKYEEGAR